MKRTLLLLTLLLLLFVLAAPGQTGTGSISGTVVDAKTNKAVPSALVVAIRSGPPPLARNTRSGGDGAFQIQGLEAGSYSLCVQVQGGAYLDPCQWTASPTLTLVARDASRGISIRLTAASVVSIQVKDAQKALSQTTRDGRRPELTVGVWGPNGLYYPARLSGLAVGGVSPPAAEDRYSYQMAVPRDTALTLDVASRDLKLGDAVGAALPGNASRQPFQHTAGDTNQRSFAFTVLGLLP